MPFQSLRAHCVIFATLACMLGCCESPADITKTNPHVLSLDGSSIDLLGQRPNAIKVAIFVRSDCPIANRYAPEIRRLDEKYHPANVDIYLVYVDPRETSDTIRKHLREYGYQCRAVRDPHHDLVRHCGVRVTPEAVVFAPDGKIAYTGRINDLYVDVGQPRNAATMHDLVDALDAVIAGRPVAVARTKAVGCLIADLQE